MKPYTVILVDYLSDSKPILNLDFVDASHPKAAVEIAYERWPDDAPEVTIYMVIDGHIREREHDDETP